MLNYYEFLKIASDSSHTEIELAFAEFKKELLKFSPGIDINDSELRLRKPSEWDAFKILLNPTTRKEHDELLEREIELEQKEYEQKSKLIESEGERKSSNKAGFLFLIIVAVAFGLCFLISKVLEEPEKTAKWFTHHITDDVKIMLPAKTDTALNILPPYLYSCFKSGATYKSELSNSFCVSIAVVEMEDHFRVSFKDLAYMTSMEEQSPKVRNKQENEIINATLGDYRVSIEKGTYQYENLVRASENYTMLSGTTGIKVIVNYNPGDELQVKYSEIIYKSLMN